MGDSAASGGVRAGGTGQGTATLKHHHATTKAVHEAEELPVVSENGKVESCVESPQGAPASSASPHASPPCSQSMTPAAAPDTEAQTVTSSQTSHTRTSFQSSVSLQGAGGGLQSDVQPQGIQNFTSQSQAIHSQSIQTGSVSQSHDAIINGHQPFQTSTSVSGQQTFHTVSQSQSVQSVSQTQSAQTVVQAQAAVGVNDQSLSVLEAPAYQPRIEPHSVDENANSITERVPAQPQPEPVPEASVVQENPVPIAAPEPAVVSEPVAAPKIEASEPTVVPEPATAPEPAPEPAVAPEAAVIAEPVPEPQQAATPEPPVAPEEVVVPEPAPTPAPQQAAPPEAAVVPEPAAAVPEPVTEAEPAVEEEVAVVPESVTASEEAVTQEPTTSPEATVVEAMVDTQQSALPPGMTEEIMAAPEPQPAEEVFAGKASPNATLEPRIELEPSSGAELMTVPESETYVSTTISDDGGPMVEEIQQEHIKEQLHEIITEIERQVLPEQEQEQQQQQQLEEDGVKHHTWKPKGRYEVPKTVVQYEEVVPIPVPDVAFSLRPQPPKPAPPPEPEPPKPEPQHRVEVQQEPPHLTNGAVSPIEIPEGIPLLARILPKDHEDGERKISLERLFTPATDSGDLTPKRSPSKKAFASSSFYRPDHPTIDDQVELAQRISFSLVDENNKMSRGQSMYMKRKKRSMRWIHAGAGEGVEGLEEDHTLKHPPMKPPMKLLMSPKGVQDFHAVQEHYQALMEAAVPTSPEVGKIVTEVQSPTGKGAELFAKRKKRMDKFIVDETTVQKAQTSTRTQQQQQPVNTTADDLAFKKSAVEERNRQQHQIMEQFLRSREGSLTLVKSPWQAAMETGTADAAFDDKRQRIKLANTVVERADSKLAEAASWLEPPKPMPLMPTLGVEVTATPAAAPSVPRAMLSPEDSSSKRNSASFNMAAKGWGTYSRHYTPVTFAT